MNRNEETAEQTGRHDLYRVLSKVVWLSAGVFLLLWFLDAATVAILFFLLAMIFAIALNAPVLWLEKRNLPRWAATLVVCLLITAVFALLGWLVVPRLVKEAAALSENIPEYASQLSERATGFLAEYPQVQERLRGSQSTFVERLLPSVQAGLARVGRYSLTAITLLIFGILLISTIIYMLLRPRPLLEGYLSVFPPRLKDPATNAFAKGSQAVIGWLYSNIIIGGIEGIAAAIFLSVMNVPGALVWGVMTFFAELVPKVGPYLMTIPPVLVALAVDPMTALWVLVFYVAIQELTGSFIAPTVRAKQMDIHPVSIIFAVLALGSAFGLLGALIATPVTGFIKAFCEEFYLARQPRDEKKEARIEAMLSRKAPDQLPRAEQLIPASSSRGALPDGTEQGRAAGVTADRAGPKTQGSPFVGALPSCRGS